MQHLRSQKEENNTKRESAASGRDFHLCSTTSCFFGVFFVQLQEKEKSHEYSLAPGVLEPQEKN